MSLDEFGGPFLKNVNIAVADNLFFYILNNEIILQNDCCQPKSYRSFYFS